MPVKLSINEIKNKLNLLFDDRYTFNFDNYVNTHSKISVDCKIHGITYKTVKNLLNGVGCKKCSYVEFASKNTYSNDKIILDFKSIHGDRYDYSKFNYISSKIKSIIICKEHGEYMQSYDVHMRGHGCSKCSNNKKMDKNDFIRESELIHGGIYNYDSVEYINAHTKVDICCYVHGIFSQLPMSHFRGYGCPKCNQSKGEKLISQYLNEYNIKYEYQKKFDGCEYINLLIFDFYLPDYNTCIEFNGIQHYYPIDIFGGLQSLEKNKIRDNIKVNFCDENNINLLIIKQDVKHMRINEVKKQINLLLSEFFCIFANDN